jgi:hypothetical protein
MFHAGASCCQPTPDGPNNLMQCARAGPLGGSARFCRHWHLQRLHTSIYDVQPRMVFGLLFLLGNLACSEQRCTGPIIECSNFSASGCVNVPGCSPVPGCAISDKEGDKAACSLRTTVDNCSAPKCAWTGSACVDYCSTISDQQVCGITKSPLNSDRITTWGCLWTPCTGVPKTRFCSDYSTTMCPAGCSVQSTCPLGDC